MSNNVTDVILYQSKIITIRSLLNQIHCLFIVTKLLHSETLKNKSERRQKHCSHFYMLLIICGNEWQLEGPGDLWLYYDTVGHVIGLAHVAF